MLLLCLCGDPRVGKDTVADYLVQRYGFEKLSLATPIKDAARSLFSLSKFEESDEVKDLKNKAWEMTPREMWCHIGDAFKNEFGPEITVASMMRKLSKLPDDALVVIPDVRFQAEVDAFRPLAHFVHVQRHSAPRLRGAIAKHEAHRGVEILIEDYVLDNNGDLQSLFYNVDELLEMLE